MLSYFLGPLISKSVPRFVSPEQKKLTLFVTKGRLTALTRATFVFTFVNQYRAHHLEHLIVIATKAFLTPSYWFLSRGARHSFHAVHILF